jgi:hypothetical protein
MVRSARRARRARGHDHRRRGVPAGGLGPHRRRARGRRGDRHLHDHRRPRPHPRARRQRAKDAGLETVSVSIDGLLGHPRPPAGGPAAATDAALEALAVPQGRRDRPADLRQHPALPPQPQARSSPCSSGHAARYEHPLAGRCRSPSRWAAPPIEPELLLQPWRDARGDADGRAARQERLRRGRQMRLWPGSNIGYFGPYEGRLRGDHMPRRPPDRLRGGPAHPRHRGQRRHQRLPLLAHRRLRRRQPPQRPPARRLGASRRPSF